MIKSCVTLVFLSKPPFRNLFTPRKGENLRGVECAKFEEKSKYTSL